MPASSPPGLPTESAGATTAPPRPDAAHNSGVPRHQCGRCRLSFAGDPTLHAAALPDWWLCPSCRTALLGDA
jgi:hypothetical protein